LVGKPNDSESGTMARITILAASKGMQQEKPEKPLGSATWNDLNSISGSFCGPFALLGLSYGC
jgi:hypothetical protein